MGKTYRHTDRKFAVIKRQRREKRRQRYEIIHFRKRRSRTSGYKNPTHFIVDVTTFFWVGLKYRKTWSGFVKSQMERSIAWQIVASTQWECCLIPKFRSWHVALSQTNWPFTRMPKTRVRPSVFPTVRILLTDLLLTISQLKIRVSDGKWWPQKREKQTDT